MYSYRNDFGVTSLSLQVGCDESERRIVWHQIAERKGAQVRYAKAEDYDRDGGFTDDNSTVVRAVMKPTVVNRDFISCKARLCGLESGTEYVYNIGDGEEYDLDVYRFSMPRAPFERFCFGVVSDVHFNVYQRKADNGAYLSKFFSWNNTLCRIRDYADEHPAFIMSIGDNTSVFQMGADRYAHPSHKTPEGSAMYSEKEYEEFFTVPPMKQIAIASVLGNHDSVGYPEPSPYSSVTGFHFDMPNDDGRTGHFLDNSHGNFYFTCGDVLIIGMNVIVSNYGNYCGDIGMHREFIERAIEACPEAKWRIIFNHVPAYAYVGSADIGDNGLRTECSKMRYIFNEIIRGIDVDIVFSGHQHCFSRTFNILDGEVVDRDKLVTETDDNGNVTACITDPRGVLHYNAPAPSSFSFFSSVDENCHETYANYGIGIGAFRKQLSNGYKAALDFRGFTYAQPMFTHVTVENGETSSKITIKSVGVDDGIARDTYTIEKTNKH